MSTPRLCFCLYLLGFSFTATLARAATVTTLPPTGFSASSATLNAVANPGGTAYFGHFEYGLTTSYGSQTGDQILGDGNNNVNFNQVVTGLTIGQIYHYRADILPLKGITIHGNDQAFFMPGAPAVITFAPGPFHPGEATLNATINPNNEPTAYWFQHGPTTNYGRSTATNLLPAGTNIVAVSNLITGLPRGVPYHFAVVATNAFGQSVGADALFTVPQGVTTPGGSTGGGQAFDIRQPCLELNFIICTNGVFPEGNLGIPLLGEICLFAGNFAPAGWALCQGQLFSTSNELFDLMGTAYGGDGITNFALPNFQGFRAVEAGSDGVRSWVVSQVFGFNQETLSLQQVPSHTHSLPFPDGATGTAGGGQQRINVQPSLAINYLFTLVGIFPAQGSTTITEPFLGQVMLSAGPLLPGGSAFVNGQALSVRQNAALLAVIGTTYGGDGQNNFNLPNLQSRVPIGTGQGQMSFWSLGQPIGAESPTMTTAQMPAHQHTVPALGIMTGFTGSNQPLSLIQPSLVLQYLISTNGQIPSASIQATNAMLGEIQIYAGTNLPGGWLPCDGRLMQVASSPSLFGVISNWFGGDGVTTFALPDLRGRVPVGTTNGQPGAAYGAEQTVLTVANLPPHTHTGPVPDFDRWITSFGLSGVAAGFSADADADQAANGYEWATDSNPTNAQSFGSLTISSTRSNVLIGFPRNTNATDVVFIVLRSTNLANPGAWSAIATNTAGVWTSAATVTESGSTNPVNVTIPDALTNAASANYRLQLNWP